MTDHRERSARAHAQILREDLIAWRRQGLIISFASGWVECGRAGDDP
jgi:hypothetical protein